MAAAMLAVSLLGANSIGSYAVPGGNLAGSKGLPQPIGWIAQVLVIESWPTFREVEIQWIAWALGAVGLVVLALLGGRKQDEPGRAKAVLSVLSVASAVLLLLVGIRAVFSSVPLIGLAWTWQLALSLLWMLALYIWTIRVSVSSLAAAVAVSISILCGISLLFCIQARQWYPNWPVGNVLLLTSSCLAGAFLLAAWCFSRLMRARRTGRPWDYLLASVLFGMLVIVMVVLSMAGRRAAVLGLTAGLVFVAVAWLLGRSQAGRVTRHVKLGLVAGLVALVAAAAFCVPRLFHSGRWESVLLRAEMYRRTAFVFLDKPSTCWVGVGPGHLAFSLTTLMRPLHAESPRLFHGDIATHTHSEPLQAIVELGLPLGFLYLLLPVGGLIGFAVAWRKATDETDQLMILGCGAALAAIMAAEATSVGMRYPGVAALSGHSWGLGGRAVLRRGDSAG